MDAARKAGAHAATVSGSGSALIAVHTEEGACAEVARAMEDALRQHNTWATARVLRSAAGAQLLPS